MKFVDAAADAGADAVKFQLFKIDQLFAPEILAKSAIHRARRAWELPLSFLAPLSQHCAERGVQFSCTPFYLDAVEELRPFVSFYKISSYELMWAPLLSACAATGKPVVLSCGLATIEEIAQAVTVLKTSGCADITLLHCVSAYPTPVAEANLSAIRLIRDTTGCKTGWSDHTRSPAVIERAVHHWNAAMVEFHLDLDGLGAEYAAGHCWLPAEIRPVIAGIRDAMQADGDGIKCLQPAEKPDRDWRADPQDGLRPFKHIRDSWEPEV